MNRAACLAALLLGVASALPASARVSMSGPDGFVSMNEAVVPAAPAAVWAQLVAWNRWWPAEHSYSGDAARLSLDPQAGGLLVERWNGQSVVHATVATAMAPRLLRLIGGFGPLQAFPVNAVLDITLAPEGSGTRLKLAYRVGGPSFVHLEEFATPVDEVMSGAFARLVAASK